MVIGKRYDSIIPYDDLYYLNEVMKTGLPLDRALQLVENDGNREIIDNMLIYLNKGVAIEEIIVHHLPDKIKEYLIPLIKVLPFKKALSLSLEFYKEEKESEKELIQSVSYPFVLLFVAITALYLFDEMGMDSIMNMLKSFNADLRVYEIIRIIIKVFSKLFYFGLLLGCVLFYYLTREKRIIITYEAFCRRIKQSIIKDIYSGRLVNYVLIAAKNGYKTKESLELIRSIKRKPILSVMAFKMDEYLLEGKDIFEATSEDMFDPLLSNYLKIAVNTTDYLSILENYIDLNRKKLKKTMKNLSLKLQLIIYAFIGAVIVFVYQILFMPLSAIGSL